MTCIAWDGKTLAADKASTNCGYAATVTKVYRVPGGIVAFAGSGAEAMELLEWFRNGRDPAKWPEFEKTGDGAGAYFVGEDRRFLAYGKTPYPQHIEDKFCATGAGRDYALAAMYLGFDARRAVEVACALDANCGNGIDTLELDQPQGAAMAKKPEKKMPGKMPPKPMPKKGC